MMSRGNVMMSRGNEKSGFGVYIRPAFWLFSFFR